VVNELAWLKKKVKNMLLEPDWLNMLVDRGDNKITSFKLTKYDFAAACLYISVFLFFWTGMQT
jgi:hypothetical protein